MLQYGFRYFSNVTLFPENKEIDAIPVWLGNEKTVGVYIKKPVRAIAPRDGKALVKSAKIVYDAPLRAPVAKDAKIATLRITDVAGQVTQYPLYAAQEVAEASVGMQILKRMGFYVTSLLSRKERTPIEQPDGVE